MVSRFTAGASAAASKIRILVIGGYGRIGEQLCRHLKNTSISSNVELVVAGRNLAKAQHLVSSLKNGNFAAQGITANSQDSSFPSLLQKLQPRLVIDVSGSFSAQNYTIPQTCIASGVNYIDLENSYEHINGISSLHEEAKAAGVFVISGAGLMPALSFAVINDMMAQNHINSLRTVDYALLPSSGAISPKNPPTGPIKIRLGEFTRLEDGVETTFSNWQETLTVEHPFLGKRLAGECDTPDHRFFMNYYPTLIQSRFFFGLQKPTVVRALHFLANTISKEKTDTGSDSLIAKTFWLFKRSKSAGDGGMIFHIVGENSEGTIQDITWHVNAYNCDDLKLSILPTLAIINQLETINIQGAFPGIGIVTMDDIKNVIGSLDLSFIQD